MERNICGKVPNGDGTFQIFYHGQENEFAQAASRINSNGMGINNNDIIYANLKNKIKIMDLTLTELNFLFRNYLARQEKN